jgi:hypothetical protein
MNAALQQEIDYRISIGCRMVSVAQMDSEFRALGYRLDRSMDCRSVGRYLTGPRAGTSHPVCTTGLKECDTGAGAWHYESRRDENFRRMQQLRNEVFAISRGAILEV